MTTTNKDPKAAEEELAADGSRAGVEAEPTLGSLDPFDPASISIEPRVVPMDTLLRRLKKGTIRLAPNFQRKYVWDDVRQSQLIESLMLRIPLPMFYVAGNEDGTWDVVDGLQRLTTIPNFILGGDAEIPAAKSFRLSGLEFWGEKFNGKRFVDIERDESSATVVNNILETEMRFTVINPGTPEEVKRNIFKRINTGGMPLTQQEIRHALYQGSSTRLLQRLGDHAKFKLATSFSIDDSRMAARELVLRFLSFLVIHRSEFTGDMDRHLSDAMRLINEGADASDAKIARIFKSRIPKFQRHSPDELEKHFETAMVRCRLLFGTHAFRKSVSGQRRTPINKALFEAWSVLICKLSDEEFGQLRSARNAFWRDYQELLQDDEFERAISRDASSVSGVRTRYDALETLVDNFTGG